ncbi:MAG TPA: Na+/H+ antiporter NhaA [Phenylobacterium sp.]|jgi:NhaA family Na+:H+ antiporter|uniref:Na+/H+ antiporter NhaA n=1 Tax=Phenylobacterium sp. TaxID=1871053 RepID=UPI002BFA83A5|nr:Na+/H+ antiporter NhaA [Phenylobacterium sp.]HXA41268.1 Na+/H+ antiporter NhaA [Phenylobacterium sp.]
MLTEAMAKRITLDFLKTESASGLVLAIAALGAIALANSPWAHVYFGFIGEPFTVQLGAFTETLPVIDWVKEGLMAVFFFVVGLEIKYEIVRGELANPRRLALPVLAALGGMLGPALIYLAINMGQPPFLEGAAPKGWPVPVATDIAFAIAALAVAGPKLPPNLRVFLLTLAIVDDLGAVGLIGLLFTEHFRVLELAGALVALTGMGLLGRWRRAPYLIYAVGFVVVWGFTLKSGISTSLAGVAAAATIPLEPRKPGRPGVLEDFMEGLHPYVAFLILPLFAFCAAGFTFRGLGLSDLFGPIAVGVAAGLFLGKQLGVFGAAALVIGLKLARRPTGAKWIELYGLSLLCGIGFTMSLFIGQLAFPSTDIAAEAQVRIGVVAGSLLSTVAGMAVLAWAQQRRAGQED